MIKTRLLVAACVLAAAMARPAAAYSTEGPVWQSGTTTFNSFMPNMSLIYSTDVSLSIASWNNVSGFKFVDTGNSADPCNNSGPNGATFGSTDCGSAFGATTLAVTTYTTTGRGFFIHAGIVFNSSTPFGSYDGPLRANVDFKRVALHELGHVLGLDHETDPNIPAIMAPNVSNLYQLQSDDIAGAVSLYGQRAFSSVYPIVSAILPSSRSVRVNATATAFATIINTGSQPATSCAIALATPIGATFSYQTTSAATNQPIGAPNTPVNIAGNGSQSFIISVTPTAPLSAIDVAFTMQCTNTSVASSTTGLNTLLLSASTTPVPDIVALAATKRSDGYVGVITGTGAFAVATVNLGATGDLIVSADTGSSTVPVSMMLCQTDPVSGQCISPIVTSLPVTITTNATLTFAVFVTANASFTPDPANKRIFLRFRDNPGGVTRGATSVAVSNAE
ncbi:MAG: putative peptidase family [Rhodospirillales bacterium]|nr:putative peptidase family [Rhodospirillales bacterium]